MPDSFISEIEIANLRRDLEWLKAEHPTKATLIALVESRMQEQEDPRVAWYKRDEELCKNDRAAGKRESRIAMMGMLVAWVGVLAVTAVIVLLFVRSLK